MKKTLLIASLAVFTLSSFAQNTRVPGPPPPNAGANAKQKVGKLMETLDLTLDQKAQLKKLHTDQQLAMAKFREQQKKDSKAAFEKILTPAQKTKLDQLKALQKQSQENRANEKAQFMKISLGLSDEQFTKLQKQRKELQSKLKAVKEDAALTPEQKREKAKSIFKEEQDSLQQVLTAEQLKKFRELKRKGPAGHTPPMQNGFDRTPQQNGENRAPKQVQKWQQ